VEGVTASPFTLSHQAVHVGNSLLELAAEFGVAGAVLFVALLALLLLHAARTAFRDPGPAGTVALVAIDLMIAAIVVSFLGSPLQDATPALLFWVAAGLAAGSATAAASGARTAAVDSNPATRAGRASLRLSLAAAWAIVAVAAGVWIEMRFAAGRRTLEGEGCCIPETSKVPSPSSRNPLSCAPRTTCRTCCSAMPACAPARTRPPPMRSAPRSRAPRGTCRLSRTGGGLPGAGAL